MQRRWCLEITEGDEGIRFKVPLSVNLRLPLLLIPREWCLEKKKETEKERVLNLYTNKISMDIFLKPENLYADTNPRMKMKCNKMELHTDFLSRMMLGDRMPSNISVSNNDEQLPELQDQAPPANVRYFLNKKNITETSKHKINLDIDKEIPTHRFVTPLRSPQNELRSFVPVSA
ncbi:hypothetical protein Bpfe_022699 [Biomphalaria pfeifferi]|uniref:Uncharacterized protein n=1 Tax=Biomphalaria pfeifferi TaxID=112525 RepID=A0AAD8F1K2_BIOPF|nr:hypothetical protein Bpfe_022699 [Biomphalaria pfeifferi]